MRLSCIDGVVPPVSLAVDPNSGGVVLASLVTLNRLGRGPPCCVDSLPTLPLLPSFSLAVLRAWLIRVDLLIKCCLFACF